MGGGVVSILWSSYRSGSSIVAANDLFMKLFINLIGINIFSTILKNACKYNYQQPLNVTRHTTKRVEGLREKKGEGRHYGSISLREVM